MSNAVAIGRFGIKTALPEQSTVRSSSKAPHRTTAAERAKEATSFLIITEWENQTLNRVNYLYAKVAMATVEHTHDYVSIMKTLIKV
jgi:hypothetical protein